MCTMNTEELIGATPLAVVISGESLEESVIESQLTTIPECDTFLGISGGQAVDLVKYFAWKRGKRLVTTCAGWSVNAFVTPSAGIWRGNDIVYFCGRSKS